MFWIIGVIVTVILLVAVVMAIIYLAVSYIDTPSNVYRVVTTFGEATHVMKPGPGFIYLGIQQFYDYDRRKFVIDLEAEDIFTGKVKGAHDSREHDEMPLKIDSTLIFDFAKSNDLDMLDVFNNGLAPDAGGIFSNSDPVAKIQVTEFVKKFVHAVQSDLVGTNSYGTILFHKRDFSKIIQEALRTYEDRGSINPFKVLHVNQNLTYVINKVFPPPDFIEAMAAKAIADQKGEGVIATAKHQRVADELELTLIDKHVNAASIKVMQTHAESGRATFFIPTNIADGLGHIVKSLGG